MTFPSPTRILGNRCGALGHETYRVFLRIAMLKSMPMKAR